MSLASYETTPTISVKVHPFDPVRPEEIRLGVRILEAAFPGVPLRYNRIDIHEPIKQDVIPYIEAERQGKPLPPRPARLLYSYFNRLDTGVCLKALMNADTRSLIYAKELPEGVQVRLYPWFPFSFHRNPLSIANSHPLILMK
jgi:primary-amine oxidase